MNLATKTKNNENFYIKDGKLYSIYKNESLCKILDYNDYQYGTHISFYNTGVKVENNNFGRLDYRFYNNNGNLLANIQEDNPKSDNEVSMYVLKNGILSVYKDFSDFTVFKFTKYNGQTKVNYDVNKIFEIINHDDSQGLSM